jgi:hypothetical protein
LKNQVTAYQETWEKVEASILETLQEVVHLHFKQSFIIVYITRYLHTVSDPLIISGHFSPEEFRDILTHELIHILLVYNCENYTIKNLLKHDIFSEYTKLTQIHILVFAIEAYIYEVIFHTTSDFLTQRLEKTTYKEYKLALKIVKTIGYFGVIRLLNRDIKNSSSLR